MFRQTFCLFLLVLLLVGVQDSTAARLKDRVSVLEQQIESLKGDIERDRSLNNVADLEVRLARLDTEIRSLIGRIEQQDFLLQQLQKKVSALSVASQKARSSSAPPKTVTVPPAPQKILKPTTSPVSVLPEKNNTLGAISEKELDKFLPWKTENSSSATQKQAPKNVTSSPEKEYGQAFDLLGRGKYDEAERAFQKFIASYPTHELTGNAQYWLAETYYVRGLFEKAAIAFAEGYKKYAKSPKSPDNLLKLGMALSQIKRREDACLAYLELKDRYPEADSNIKDRMMQEIQKNKCSE